MTFVGVLGGLPILEETKDKKVIHFLGLIGGVGYVLRILS